MIQDYVGDYYRGTEGLGVQGRLGCRIRRNEADKKTENDMEAGFYTEAYRDCNVRAGKMSR